MTKQYGMEEGSEIETKSFRFKIGNAPRNCVAQMRNAQGDFESLARLQSFKVEYGINDPCPRVTLEFADLPI